MGTPLPENSLLNIPQVADLRVAIETLVTDFAASAAERDQTGGTAKRERDLIRQSGLLRLVVPQHLGGIGANWIETLSAVRRLANVDSSLAHLFAFHHLMLATLQFFGAPQQAEELLRTTVRDNWFWGNAMNPLDPRTRLTRTATGYRLDGEKSFCSGASDSDRLIVSAIDESETLRILAVPTSRLGIVINDDWDNMGQRQTDSGTVSFTDVFVAADEILRDPGPMGSPYASLRPSLAQLILTNIYLGIAEGALEQARTYLHGLPPAALERIGEDPYVLRNFGDLWVEVAGARALTDQALQAFQYGWEAGREGVTAELRGEIAIAIATAKVASSRASLNVSNRIFEVMGARATTAHHRFDRYWRNARTHTLHDPLDYKLRELGNWAVKSQVPSPSFYS